MVGRILSRIGTLVVAALIGAAFGVAGTVAHTSKLFGLPFGIPIAAIGCVAIVVAVRLLTSDRGAATATGFGVLGAVLLLSGRGPGGSVIVPDGAAGIAWIVVIGVLMLLVVAWPSLPQRAPANDGDGASPVRLRVAGEAGVDIAAGAAPAAPEVGSTRRLEP